MALYKKEVLVRETSSLTDQGIIDAVRSYVNSLQDNATAGKFYFADAFDSRNSKLIRVYSDACAAEYSITPQADGSIVYVLIDPANAGGSSGGGEDITIL